MCKLPVRLAAAASGCQWLLRGQRSVLAAVTGARPALQRIRCWEICRIESHGQPYLKPTEACWTLGVCAHCLCRRTCMQRATRLSSLYGEEVDRECQVNAKCCELHVICKDVILV